MVTRIAERIAELSQLTEKLQKATEVPQHSLVEATGEGSSASSLPKDKTMRPFQPKDE